MQSEPKAPTWHKKLLLICTALFLVTQIYLTLAPFLNRELPVEADDAYSYILKAEQMRTCFLQDCEALTTLRDQMLAASDQESIGAQQIRQYHRLFVVYHPLHSFLLLILGAFGLSFEAAYMLLAVITKAVLSIGIVYWLSTLFGKPASAIAILMLVPIVYVGTGIHTIVPSSMALALAFWLWTLIAKRKSNLQIIFILLSLGMMLFHQAGKLYAGVALVLYILMNYRIMNDRRQQLFVIGAGALIGIFLLLPYFVDRPQLNFDPASFYPFEWDLLSAIIPASAYPFGIMTTWFWAFSFPIIGGLLLLLGLFAAWQQKNWTSFYIAALLTLLVSASFFYVVPWFGALFFERAWVPLAVLLTGFVGLGIYTAGTEVPPVLSNLHKHRFRSMYRPSTLFSAATILLVAAASVTYPEFYARHYGLTLHNQIDRQDFSFSPEQPATLFAQRILPQEAVLYSHELPLYYYLAHGGLAHQAVFLPLVKGSPQEQYWLTERAEDLRYLAALSPVPERKGVPLSGEVRILPSRANKITADTLQIYITSLNTDTKINLLLLQSDKTTSLLVTVPAGSTGWFVLADSVDADEILLTTEGPLKISGLRVSTLQHTRWPWQAGITMNISEGGEMTQYDFTASSLLPEAWFNIEVIDDEGSIILARLNVP